MYTAALIVILAIVCLFSIPAWNSYSSRFTSASTGNTGSAEKSKFENAVLFSALEGQLVKDGKPLPGATLIREWDFPENSVRGKDETTTDASGHFRFPAVIHPYKRSRFFPQEPIVAQLIRVQHGGAEWRAWSTTKMDLRAGTEKSLDVIEGTAPDVPLSIRIDLDSPRERRGRIAGHTVVLETK